MKWGKKRDEPSAPREPEQAKDIREDTLGWIAQQIPPAVHKVNYFLLDWAQKLAYEESERPELPGKDGSMTRNQFLAHLRDGKLLVNLANKLQPGSISVESDVTTEAMVGTEAEKRTETVVEGEKKEEQATESVKIEEKKAATPQKTLKEKQSELINKFTTWANDCLGLGEGRL
ncbi:hypothetical protein DICVIV_02199 [Dictyocaulus viviparus]|uniref:Calponin-homology (CH) domain-containing protein n=1 Tax=Dictyocaulus viviparus TaxID=29172 RepID=A0A0D8Y457_DICVI|nr:hypothetical protein DICVIV_02199 [Dictyocaulus viviparus]